MGGGCWSSESLAVGEDPGGKDKHLAVTPSSQRGLKDVCSQSSLHFAGPPFNLTDLTKYWPPPRLIQSHCFPSFDLWLPFVSVILLFPNEMLLFFFVPGLQERVQAYAFDPVSVRF